SILSSGSFWIFGFFLCTFFCSLSFSCLEKWIIRNVFDFFVIGRIEENILPFQKPVFRIPVETGQKPLLIRDFAHRMNVGYGTYITGNNLNFPFFKQCFNNSAGGKRYTYSHRFFRLFVLIVCIRNSLCIPDN